MSRETFEALLVPHLPSLRKLVRTRLRAADHADDIVQQALLRAFAHRHQLRAHSKFKSWLSSIAINEVRMFFRRDRAMTSLDDIRAIEFRDAAPSPLARFEQREQATRVHAGIAMLSERDRATIRFRDLDGLSLEETAYALNVSLSAAKSSHLRARRRLASALRTAPGPSTVQVCRPAAPAVRN